MQQNEFEVLVKELAQKETITDVLNALSAVEEEEIAQAAEDLKGHFCLAEIEGEKRIYHVFTQENEAGEEQEFVEWVMNEGEEMLKFAAWFFYTNFEIKQRGTYQAAGRTYQQPKRA
ncbi:hypothetical protein FA893_16040 [Photobacterium damselae subsp. piscicida]|uniref:Uncharacterized protein n=1 Tax=Photobacterium damsela subsp. piscicida TaxID=38294 RepID=A0A1Q9GWK3_PHODP|nr:hypothetical protein [Photobacterium damselae]MBE8126779.1 hypothetical protein [Photobacterium damselae subsp. piscicida]MDP2513806.1 hypothetical protein [Photobacterium damselae subsp. piscicida]MDP2533987.1 hypothetical protein [Photobacterium damselae subsp. piscicida]MDP2556972.1 hypothetical protein [Photobacterium damselae subsp. piscicida]MDP2568056.1 hypothetical protein [Photobacterium damselae subsp. piscicida]